MAARRVALVLIVGVFTFALLVRRQAESRYCAQLSRRSAAQERGEAGTLLSICGLTLCTLNDTRAFASMLKGSA